MRKEQIEALLKVSEYCREANTTERRRFVIASVIVPSTLNGGSRASQPTSFIFQASFSRSIRSYLVFNWPTKACLAWEVAGSAFIQCRAWETGAWW